MTNVEEEACVASWCAGDDWCAVTCTAHLIGKKWHPVIVHRLLARGPLGFNALEDDIESISSTVLSSSLEDLEDKNLVNREIVSEKPFRVEYSLTERGASLEPVVEAMDTWGEDHLSDTSCS
ncbi:winged helix-turn-helix transcriptional regulator [Halorussus salinus]|uniref:winged helix-turn-helix transcriptional regulator n=1 Tax=Halorussus salinus TaxID=1364935 RepID=UPI0010921144|nr:helix-turn-helix domain-containing protein [Halorussus salinus]